MAATYPLASSDIMSQAYSAASSSASSSQTGSSQTVGKDEFLRLLVVQLQNQDPLNPLRNEEYISQLATFSSLEQLIGIREGIASLSALLASNTEANSDPATQA
jgi:flagellar hook assembly protein FlgD